MKDLFVSIRYRQLSIYGNGVIAMQIWRLLIGVIKV